MRNHRRLPKLHRTTQRQGMALLFVVSLILFITLLGASFVVVSQQFAASANARTRIDQRGDSSTTLVRRAFYDLVRGPSLDNTDSPLRGHDILADMNGYGIAGVIQNAAFAGAANGVPGSVEFNLDDTLLENLLPGGGAITLSDAAGRYQSLVLTFTQGELRGTSVRVIGYSGSEPGAVTGFPYTFTVYPEQSRDVPANISDIDGDRVLLNGRAYMGWGAGGLSTSGGDAKLALTALQPNLRGQTLATLQTYISTGVNESWDAIDHQNLFLG
ncbi:MAG: hypothetical protein ACR2NP_00585, partial [Pirellulaceae bacterium]